MPLVCRIKPNRTKARLFSSCDAARIAREVVKDDQSLTPEQVLACIAKGFGFTHISLSRLTVVESGINLDKKTILPLVLSLEKGLIVLSKKTKLIGQFLAPLLVILKKIIDIVGRVDIAEPPQAAVDDVIVKGKCECKRVLK
jgi:hypothetical protein